MTRREFWLSAGRDLMRALVLVVIGSGLFILADLVVYGRVNW